MTNTLTKMNETGSPAPANGRPITYLRPLTNVIETSEGYLLEAEMPGGNKPGLEITIENGELQIVGRRTGTEEKGQQIYRESRLAGFRRGFALGPPVDASKIAHR